MAMQLRLVTWNLPDDWQPDDGDRNGVVVDLLSILENSSTFEMLTASGWRPVSHSIQKYPMSEDQVSVLFEKVG